MLHTEMYKPRWKGAGGHYLRRKMGLGVAVGFLVGVLVGVGVAVAFLVGVLVGVRVAVGFRVGVLVAFCIGFGVAEAVGLMVGV